VINNSLPDDLYNKLKNEYISLSDIVLLNNDISYQKTEKVIMLNDFLYKTTRIRSLLWKQFVEYHKSSNFFNDIIDLDLENNKVNKDVSRNTCKIEFNHHSPVLYHQNRIEKNDIVKTSFLGYYFMRDEKDNSKGFNLEIYMTDKRILSIPYQKNTFVLICNNDKNIKTKFSDKGFSIYSKKYIKLSLN
jgi:hypothetical protein